MSEKHDDDGEPHAVRTPFFLTVAELSLILEAPTRRPLLAPYGDAEPKELSERLLGEASKLAGTPWAP